MRYAVFLIAGLVGFAYGRFFGAAVSLYIAFKAYDFFILKKKRVCRFPSCESEDPYSVLGVQRGDSIDSIKRAYHNLAKFNHPDIMKSRGASEKEIKQASEKMARINEAWRIISDNRKNG